MIQSKPFYFIRHGETDWNRQNICMGSTDIPLNELGIEQAKQAAQILKNQPIASIAASPLIRAKLTAEIIAEVLQKPITIIDDLQEYCAGQAQGKPMEERGKRMERWKTGEVQEGAETLQGFLNRARLGINSALQLPEPVLIVSHGAFYGAVRRLLNLPLVSITNCSIYYHKPVDEGELWEVEVINDKIGAIAE